ncbi:MAG: hypothetical protein QOF74_5803 [Caballeronia mineralivorans]|nr:hypothetical protein [Caballeronia mineralivorans]
MRRAGGRPPLETWIASHPRDSSARANATVCSMSQPPSNPRTNPRTVAAGNTKILLPGAYLRTQLSCSMPRPARIVEDRAGQRGHVCIPNPNDRFDLFDPRDQSDGDNRHRDRGFAGTRKRHLRSECAETLCNGFVAVR